MITKADAILKLADLNDKLTTKRTNALIRHDAWQTVETDCLELERRVTAWSAVIEEMPED